MASIFQIFDWPTISPGCSLPKVGWDKLQLTYDPEQDKWEKKKKMEEPTPFRQVTESIIKIIIVL